MLRPDMPTDDNLDRSYNLKEITASLEELEAEQLKLLAHITDNEQRITLLEATLRQPQSLRGYRPQFSLVENLTMALGTIDDSIVMARAVLAAERLEDAHASAACYLASRSIPFDDFPPDAADDHVENTHGWLGRGAARGLRIIAADIQLDEATCSRVVETLAALANDTSAQVR